MTIYTASKTKHAHRWRTLRSAGWPIVSTWIDEAGEGQTACMKDLWSRCIREASGATVTLLYGEAEDELKGALVEVGAAIANGHNVIAVGFSRSIASFTNHPLVQWVGDLSKALAMIEGMAESAAPSAAE